MVSNPTPAAVGKICYQIFPDRCSSGIVLAMFRPGRSRLPDSASSWQDNKLIKPDPAKCVIAITRRKSELYCSSDCSPCRRGSWQCVQREYRRPHSPAPHSTPSVFNRNIPSTGSVSRTFSVCAPCRFPCFPVAIQKGAKKAAL